MSHVPVLAAITFLATVTPSVPAWACWVLGAYAVLHAIGESS